MQNVATKRWNVRLVAGFMCFAVLALTLVGASTPAYADTAAEKQAEAQEVLNQLDAMQATLDAASDTYNEALAAQQTAEEGRDAAQERIDEIALEIADVQARLGSRARDMYCNGSVGFLDLLLGATTFEEFATSWDLLNRLNENDANLVQQEKDLKAEAEEQQSIFEEEAQAAAEKAAEAAAAEAEAQQTVAAMQATYDSLSAEAQQLLEEERAAQAAAEAAAAAAVVSASAQQAQSGGNNFAPASAYPIDNSNTGGSSTSSNAGSSPAYNPGTGNSIVDRAYSCLGAAYVWGGVGPGGYDCSGLVSYCVSGSHSRLGTTATFMNWPQVSDPQPGDVCVNWGHTGIYIGGGQMIHAADFGVGVIVGPVQGGMIIVRP